MTTTNDPAAEILSKYAKLVNALKNAREQVRSASRETIHDEACNRLVHARRELDEAQEILAEFLGET